MDTLDPRIFSNFQFLSPFSDDGEFEEFSEHYFNHYLDTTSFQIHGRSGQSQNGVDVFSHQEKIAIQCKLKSIDRSDNNNLKDLLEGLEKDFFDFKAYNDLNGKPFSKFYFVSTYKDDVQLNKRTIELSTEQSIEVQYWSWKRLLRNMPDETKKRYFNLIQKTTEEYYSPEKNNTELNVNTNSRLAKSNLTPLDESSHVLDQLYNFFQDILEDVKFIPPHILENYSPLEIEGRHRSYISKFCLDTNNEALYNFLSDVKTSGAEISFKKNSSVYEVEDYKEKTKFVLESMSNNLIFCASSAKSMDKLKVRYSSGEYCNCERCLVERFDYLRVGLLFEDKIDSRQELIIRGYAKYKLKNYTEALMFFKQAYDLTVTGKQSRSQFILAHNIQNLAKLVNSHYSIENRPKELLESIKKIEVDKLYFDSLGTKNHEFIDWIYRSRFVFSSLRKISKRVDQIRDDQRSYKNGGSSNNQHVEMLTFDYANLETFVQSNFIVYDIYLEYQEVTDLFAEGLFASHSIKNDNSNRLLFFDDWVLSKFLDFCTADKLLELLNKYQLNRLEYKESARPGNRLTDNICKLLNIAMNEDNYSHLAGIDDYNRHKNSITSYLNTAIVLASICELSKVNVNQIVSSLHEFITKNKGSLRTRYIGHFFNSKAQFLGSRKIKKFLLAGLNNESIMYSLDYFDALSNVACNYEHSVVLSKKDLKTIQSFIVEKCLGQSRNENIEIAISICLTLSVHQQRGLIKIMSDKLDSNFNSELWLLLVTLDLIDFNQETFEMLADEIELNKIATIGFYIHQSVNSNRRVNSLMNIAFKENYIPKPKVLSKFSAINKYYAWLCNMNGFDYSEFNHEWISLNTTKFYFRKMNESDELKLAIEDYLKSDTSKFDDRTRRNYLKIYIERVWDK